MKYLLSIGIGIGFYLFLFWFFPVEGGGASLIIIYTFPMILIVSGLLPLFEHLILRKLKPKKFQKCYRSIKYILILVLCYKLFPCGYYTTDCPLTILKESAYYLTHQSEIKYNDLFLDQNSSNYTKIVLAQKKFKNDLPERIFYIDYYFPNDSIDIDELNDYAIYWKNEIIYSTDEKLEINFVNEDSIRYSLDTDIETIEYFSTKDGFEKYKELYEGSGSNVDRYLYFTKVYKDFQFQVSWDYCRISDLPILYRLLYMIG